MFNYWTQKRGTHYYRNNVYSLNPNVSNIHVCAKEDNQYTFNNKTWFIELSDLYLKITQQLSSKQIFQKASLAKYFKLQK